MALAAVFGGGRLAEAQDTPTTQVSPQATEPLPPQGPGQAAMGNAVTGSAPAPGAPSPIDNSQAQQGVLLKPGQGADDMGAAAGANPQPPAAMPAAPD
jgi:hypothetical protein